MTLAPHWSVVEPRDPRISRLPKAFDEVYYVALRIGKPYLDEKVAWEHRLSFQFGCRLPMPNRPIKPTAIRASRRYP
jgi:hypothetical protein